MWRGTRRLLPRQSEHRLSTDCKKTVCTVLYAYHTGCPLKRHLDWAGETISKATQGLLYRIQNFLDKSQGASCIDIVWVLGIFSRANSIWTDYRHSERGKTQRLPLTLVDSNNCQQIGHCYCLTLNNNSGKKSRKHNAEWQTKLLYIPWVDHWTVHDLTQMMLHWNKDEPHSSLRLEWCWWMRTFLPPDEGQSPSIGRCVWSWHYGMWERRESKTRSWGRALASPCLRRGQEWWFSPVVCSSSTKNE